mmetsp:Transcript_69531/g.180461  ORF Transcript_69531/g.180461 Transcript_69531/m.180461 type:complete len:86 (+) Transcript_69531:864-1121(+)
MAGGSLLQCRMASLVVLPRLRPSESHFTLVLAAVRKLSGGSGAVQIHREHHHDRLGGLLPHEPWAWRRGLQVRDGLEVWVTCITS